jgi:hypothetical protein
VAETSNTTRSRSDATRPRSAKRRPRRDALPLPDYTRRKPLADGRWGYYFEPPTWAAKPKAGNDRGPCPVGSEPLGTDRDAAIKRVKKVLLPLYHSWRTRGLSDRVPQGPRRGTLDWLFATYRGNDKFKALRHNVRILHENGFRLIADHVLEDGRRTGDMKLSAIDAITVEAIYTALLRNRRTTVGNAMKSARRAWNVVEQLHPRSFPPAPDRWSFRPKNPFAKLIVAKKLRAETIARVAKPGRTKHPGGRRRKWKITDDAMPEDAKLFFEAVRARHEPGGSVTAAIEKAEADNEIPSSSRRLKMKTKLNRYGDLLKAQLGR